MALLASLPALAQGPDSKRATAEERAQTGYRGDGTGVSLFVPRIHRPPTLDDFAGMQPPEELRDSMSLAAGFVQRTPTDGAEASRRTNVWLAHDDTALHVVFVAWDADSAAIRGRMARREDIGADDIVTVTLDTFRDEQRAYEFSTNPLGVQRDALWTEGRTSQGDGEGGGADTSFDTLWSSDGRITEEGYVVIMSIPFKSLRFPRADFQTWGIVLWRWTPRGAAEEVTWPHVSTRLEGILNQAATITGFDNISPGRNLRMIPYGTVRSFRAIDETVRGPDFVTDTVDPAAGLDAKFVVKDAIVVDATVNPDFSQVESDQPQLTVNQRFEVFFPEKRPFFLENANYFETPLSLLFTRRIANPQFGLRATGKVGGWTIGGLGIDDRAPGRTVTESSPLSGERARHGVVRISHDLPNQSNVGLMYVDRNLHDSFNRVGGVDGRVKLGQNWVTAFQAVTSSTRTLDGEQLDGPAYYARVERSGRTFNASATYRDISDEFRAETGFIPRIGIRQLDSRANYSFRPEGNVLISHGPGLNFTDTYDRNGERLDLSYNPSYGLSLAGQTTFGGWMFGQELRLRPEDYSSLTEDRQYEVQRGGFWFDTRLLRSFELNSWQGWGTAVNFVPAAGATPELGHTQDGEIVLAYRPTDRVRVSGRWLHAYLSDATTGANIFRSDVFRARLDWQFTREFSLRLIGQYESVDANPEFTSLETTQSVNADFLATYLVNPWTALYVGYNSNSQNLELIEGATGNLLRRTKGRFLNDANQLFVKLSYLFSY
ncbi:MAG: hypothetical protein GKS06_03235 [Acidobacteria bacterium]|nr:hypothetical protein [Acidobacteriota bacterium]